MILCKPRLLRREQHYGVSKGGEHPLCDILIGGGVKTPSAKWLGLMVMQRKRGIKLLDEREGQGTAAETGDRVVYNLKLFLNKGDEVPLNERLAEQLPPDIIRSVEGYHFVDHRTTLGSRDTIAGVEYSLIGMKKGGYRKVRVSPHLAYRDQGLGDMIPSNAVLIIELWLREVTSARPPAPQ